MNQKITPFLWFDSNGEEAVNFYVSIFKNSKIIGISRMPENESGEPGAMITANFRLDGQEFIALNGGPHYKFTEAISLLVDCKSQREVDSLWERLSEGGEPGQCGWLKDKFGLSWQIIPSALGELMGDPDPAKAGRVMKAMMQMTKINIEELRAAHAGR